MKRTPRRLIGMFIAVAAVLAIAPAAASANLSLTGSHAQPANLAAGAHSDFNVHVAFGSEDVKDLTISLPPGEVGNPQATPELCNPSALPNCPADTAVGTVATSVTIASLVPQTLNGTVYNLVPQPGEPARFGIVINALPISLPPPLNGLVLPPTVIQSGAALRQSDLGLDTIVHDIPNSAALLGGLPITVPIHIGSMDLTLDGIAPGPPPSPFMRNPTSCTPHVVGFAGDSHSSATVVTANSPAFTPTNCGALDFSPSFTAEVGGPGQTTNGVATTASTAILQDTDEAGLLNAVVKVPSDLNPNATLLFGSHCDQTSFQAGTCPANTVVGLATAASPLLSQPLVGNVELVDSGGPFPNLGLDLRGQLHLLLQGAVSITGGNTVAFNGLPDIPIARFQLTFTNPPGMLGTSRDLCVPPAPLFHADFTGYNGASSSVDSAATVDGCGAGGSGNVGGKCKKHKAKKKHKHRAAASKKKHKKKSCKKKKRHKKHR
ncbi:MAG: hypothetical protein QOE58_2441 [Actinomycetota bacterium]|jgi:hypothetical protein|nr:hypothetical protein [Actinomycetota bacterium]